MPPPPSLKLPMPDTYIINPIVIIGTVCVCVCVLGRIQTYGKGGQNELRHYIVWFGKVIPNKRSQPADNSCPPHQLHIYS